MCVRRLVPRFSLRAMLLGAFAIAVVIGIVCNAWWVPFQERAAAVARLKAKNVKVRDVPSNVKPRPPEPPADSFVGKLLAENRANKSVKSISFSRAPEFAVDADLIAIATLESVEELDLTRLEVTRIQRDGVPGQHWENVGSPHITDTGIVAIAALPRLKFVCASGAKLTDVGCMALSKSKSLQTVGIDDTQITDDGLFKLANIPTLRYLSIRIAPVTQEAIIKFRQLRPDVKLLSNHPN